MAIHVRSRRFVGAAAVALLAVFAAACQSSSITTELTDPPAVTATVPPIPTAVPTPTVQNEPATPGPTRLPEPTSAPTTPAPTSAPRPTVDDGTGVRPGSRGNPFPLDTPIIVEAEGFAGSTFWQLEVGPSRDVAAELGSAAVEDPPPDGHVYLAFDVTARLLGADPEAQPVSTLEVWSWEVLGGASNAVYDEFTIETSAFGCPFRPGAAAFGEGEELFVGGELSGFICIPVPEADLGSIDTLVAVAPYASDVRFAFGPGGTASSGLDGIPPTESGVVSGPTTPGSRANPYSWGAPVTVEVGSYGDSDGSVWSVTVGEPRSVLDLVLQNEFNEPPPDGVDYLGFDVELRLESAELEPLAPGLESTWKVYGGATSRVWDVGTIWTGSLGCGSVPDSFDPFDAVFVDGTIRGTVCIPVPTADVGHPDTRVALTFNDAVVFGG